MPLAADVVLIFHQLWLLDGGFKRDSFVYYGSSEEDNSIVYRITTNTATNTATVSKFLAPFTRIKANYVLLKVQLPTPCEAYNALKANVPRGFRGPKIREFVRVNKSKILTEKREYNTMRVYTIAWAPNGDKCRLEGMDRFIWKVIGGELNVDNWTNLMRLAVSVTIGGPN